MEATLIIAFIVVWVLGHLVFLVLKDLASWLANRLGYELVLRKKRRQV